MQTPTLALIVNRQKEIENFVPTQYWELKTVYRDITFNATKGKFDTLAEGEDFLKSIQGKEFTVTKVTEKKGTEYAPRLFDLTSLQVECNKKYSFSADDTLKTIQSLYEKKITTYPRVDTTFLSDDIYPKCPQILVGLTDYASIIEPLKGKKLPKSKKVFDNSKVTDHHAIIPTGVRGQNLTPMEQKVYDLVVRRFMAVLSEPFQYDEVKIEIGADKGCFFAKGKTAKVQGWKEYYGSAVDDEDDDEPEDKAQSLPVIKEGGKYPVLSTKITQGKTKPPARYTEATLLSAMENPSKSTVTKPIKTYFHKFFIIDSYLFSCDKYFFEI